MTREQKALALYAEHLNTLRYFIRSRLNGWLATDSVTEAARVLAEEVDAVEHNVKLALAEPTETPRPRGAPFDMEQMDCLWLTKTFGAYIHRDAGQMICGMALDYGMATPASPEAGCCRRAAEKMRAKSAQTIRSLRTSCMTRAQKDTLDDAAEHVLAIPLPEQRAPEPECPCRPGAIKFGCRIHNPQTVMSADKAPEPEARRRIHSDKCICDDPEPHFMGPSLGEPGYYVCAAPESEGT